MKRLIGIAVVALAVLTVSTPAQAGSFTFTKTCTPNADPGLVVHCTVGLGPTVVVLNTNGASVTLPFGEIGTHETAANFPEDFIPDFVFATFTFSSPAGVGGVTGLAGYLLAGYVTWTPTIVVFGPTTLGISIDTAIFGLNSATVVNYTLTCLTGCDLTPGQQAIVPEPASMVLLGTGLLGLAIVARRRRKAA